MILNIMIQKLNKKFTNKSGMILLIGIAFHSLVCQPNDTLFYIQPFEVTLGKYYLLKANSSQNIESYNVKIDTLKGNNLFINTTTKKDLEFQPIYFKNYYQVLNHYIFKKETLEIQILPYYDRQNIPWLYAFKNFYLRSIITYGLPLNKQEISTAFFGIINEQKFHSETIKPNHTFVDYHQVFFVPGIQLRSQSFILKTFFEFPIYEIDFLTKTQRISPPSSYNLKANIQIQIQN